MSFITIVVLWIIGALIAAQVGSTFFVLYLVGSPLLAALLDDSGR